MIKINNNEKKYIYKYINIKLKRLKKKNEDRKILP